MTTRLRDKIPFRRSNIPRASLTMPIEPPKEIYSANERVKRSTVEFLKPNENVKADRVRKYLWPFFYGKGTRLGFAFIIAVMLVG